MLQCVHCAYVLHPDWRETEKGEPFCPLSSGMSAGRSANSNERIVDPRRASIAASPPRRRARWLVKELSGNTTTTLRWATASTTGLDKRDKPVLRHSLTCRRRLHSSSSTQDNSRMTVSTLDPGAFLGS